MFSRSFSSSCIAFFILATPPVRATFTLSSSASHCVGRTCRSRQQKNQVPNKTKKEKKLNCHPIFGKRSALFFRLFSFFALQLNRQNQFARSPFKQSIKSLCIASVWIPAKWSKCRKYNSLFIFIFFLFFWLFGNSFHPRWLIVILFFFCSAHNEQFHPMQSRLICANEHVHPPWYLASFSAASAIHLKCVVQHNEIAAANKMHAPSSPPAKSRSLSREYSPVSTSSGAPNCPATIESNETKTSHVVQFRNDLDMALDQILCDQEDVFEPSQVTTAEQSTVGPLVHIQSRRAQFQRAYSCPQEQLLPNLPCDNLPFEYCHSKGRGSNVFGTRNRSSANEGPAGFATSGVNVNNFGCATRRLSRTRAFSSLDCGLPNHRRTRATATARWASQYPIDDAAAATVLKAKLKSMCRHFYLDGGYGHVIAVLTTIIVCLLDGLQFTFPLITHFLLQQNYARSSLLLRPGTLPVNYNFQIRFRFIITGIYTLCFCLLSRFYVLFNTIKPICLF